MIESRDFVKNLTEPKREVVARFMRAVYSVSISDHETHVLAAAKELAREGWLLEDGTTEAAGRMYTRFRPGRLEVQKIRPFF